jgi:TPR repeat protein
MWRNEKKLRRALLWLRRAVKLGAEDSNLDIAKLYLFDEHNPRKAIPYLCRVLESDCVSQASTEEAQRLLKRAKKELNTTNH